MFTITIQKILGELKILKIFENFFGQKFFGKVIETRFVSQSELSILNIVHLSKVP